MDEFKTIKPLNTLLHKYISYYYIHTACNPHYRNEYICYPHYNNSLSLYKSHVFSIEPNYSTVTFRNDALPLQIFTPLREQPLRVIQKGPVYKICIVFNPFGFNQFRNSNIAKSKTINSPTFYFFDNSSIDALFSISDPQEIALALDDLLLKQLSPYQNIHIEKALLYCEGDNELSINDIAGRLGISRKHLNRLFQNNIGTSIQKYRSIFRFRKLMDRKLSESSRENLSTLSHLVNYSDQSHFIKHCKLFTGLKPSQFFKEGTNLSSENIFWTIRQ